MSAATIYARYSSDLQRDASIEDQIRLCQERAKREGWHVHQCYTDHGISGASLMRPGIQMLSQDAQPGRFDLIVAEALDRLSRDQEDIAYIYKRARFAGVKILTLSECDVNELHIDLKGTMGALFLKDLADKTRRGLRGRVEARKSWAAIAMATTWCAVWAPTGCPPAANAASTRRRPRSCGALLAQTGQEPPVLLHPNMGKVYRAEVAALAEALNDESCRAEAAALGDIPIKGIPFFGEP